MRAGLLRQGEDALLNPGEIGGVPAGVAVGVEGQGPGDGVPFVQGGQGVPDGGALQGVGGLDGVQGRVGQLSKARAWLPVAAVLFLLASRRAGSAWSQAWNPWSKGASAPWT